jgi:hypothetical protein
VKKSANKSSTSHFTARCKQKRSVLSTDRFPSGLHDADISGKFPFRQGLWIEDLRTPPGQECSNGSLILLAVVLWRAFYSVARASGLRGFGVASGDACATMKLLKTKTARFSQVVERCGQPEVYTLWRKPTQDRHFQSQIKNSRVMTILKSESGTEFGMAGFKERKGATYLLFSKSLKRFADKRIVGIDWQLVGP